MPNLLSLAPEALGTGTGEILGYCRESAIGTHTADTEANIILLFFPALFSKCSAAIWLASCASQRDFQGGRCSTEVTGGMMALDVKLLETGHG